MINNHVHIDELTDASAAWWALVQLTGPTPRPLPRPMDWDRIIDLAARHKSVLLLSRGIETVAGIEVPDAARRRLAETSCTRAREALMLARDVGRVSKAMQDAGISASVMKGAPLSQLVHGDLAARDYGDIDYLIPADQINEAASVLGSMGYSSDYRSLLRSTRPRRRLMRVTNQLQFVGAARGSGIELHWRWQKFDGMMPTDPARIWSKRLTIAGMREVLVPDGVEHFIYLCAHGLSHGWMRLKWLNDIRWTLHNGRLVQNDWRAVVQRARAIGMANAVGAAVLAAARIDKAPLPDPLWQLVQDAPKCETLAAQSLDVMLETASLREDPPQPRSPFKIAHALLRHVELSAADTPTRRSSRLGLLLAPTPPELAMVDLPRGLEAAYLLIRAARMGRRLFPV